MAKIAKFTGLNNVAPAPENARPGDLQTATSVIIDNDGAIVRRKALVQQVAGTCHDVFADDSVIYYVSGTSLMSYDGSESELVQNLTVAAMRFWKINDSIYYSNGYEYGVIENGAVRSWGLDEPAAPTATPATGSLVPATYVIALTYVRTNGMESGTSDTVLCDVVNGGIALSGIVASADPDVIGIAVYVSGSGGEALPDGSGLRLAVLLPNASGSHTITDQSSIGSGRRCATFGVKRPPPPTHSFFYGGRMYYTSLNVMWYSPYYQFECINADRAFLVLPAVIRMAKPTANGIWVGTHLEYFFMVGKDPVAGGMAIVGRQPYGVSDAAVIVNSADTGNRRLAPGEQVMFVAECGVVLGDSAGSSVVLTDLVWKPSSISTTGQYCAVDRSHGCNLFLFTVGAQKDMLAVNIRNGAVTDMGVAVTGIGSYKDSTYCADVNGVNMFGAGDVDDTGGNIDAEIEKRGLTFGASYVKSITEIYFLMAMAGDFVVETIAGGVSAEGASYPGTVGVGGLVHYKVKCARGLRGASLGFNLTNVDGCHFRIVSVEPVVSASQTRRGRQVIG